MEKHILLKFKDTEPSNPETINKYFQYCRLRDKDYINNISNLDEIVYRGNYIVINVKERYRYKPIPVKVILNDLIVEPGQQSNVPKKDVMQKHRSELEEITGRDIFSEIYPLILALDDKIKELYFEKFKNSVYISKKVMNDYKQNNGMTIKSLLSILRYLINTVYPEEIMGDRGVTCSITLNNDTISYNMD